MILRILVYQVAEKNVAFEIKKKKESSMDHYSFRVRDDIIDYGKQDKKEGLSSYVNYYRQINLIPTLTLVI